MKQKNIVLVYDFFLAIPSVAKNGKKALVPDF